MLTIESKQDFVIAVFRAIGDVQVAQLIADIAEHIGRDGGIRIERGGHGYPYEVEYPRPVERARERAVRRQLKELAAQRDATTSDADRRGICRQIAELAGAIAIVRVNVDSDTLFQETRQKLVEGVSVARGLADGEMFAVW